MYLLNHSLHQNTNFSYRAPLLATSSPVSGDRLYRNDGHLPFTDVTKQSGINSSVIGYGLGVVISDLNLDGWPDIYVGNDFHENDYLYINQKNGRFQEELGNRVMHTSKFSMGVDAADLNNDAYPEVVSMDMLADNPKILKRSLGDEEFDLFNDKLKFGYNYQYSRNSLQYNRGNGMFSEIGFYAGIAATDWSWAPLFVDFDNDGLKDLFISNGIPKRMNDIDFINYISDEGMQRLIMNNKMEEVNMSLIDKFPQIKIPNKFFKNAGALKFTDMENGIGNNPASYSNGAAYADFDNDGDLDIVVNNIDAPAILYENRHYQKDRENNNGQYLSIRLQGPEKNRDAIGAQLFLFSKGQVRSFEQFPVRGFLSSMSVPIHIGLENMVVDSMILVWPDRSCQRVSLPVNKNELTITYQKDLPAFSYALLNSERNQRNIMFEEITRQSGLDYLHQENAFVEFDREPLIPHMVSTEGPALAVADINHDGLDDVYIGSSKGYKPILYLQLPSGKLQKTFIPAFENDSTYEDVDAVFADVNKDGNIDLLVASGGNEYYGQDAFMLPRLYLNDGKGMFTRAADAFRSIYVNASCIRPFDFNGDGYVDLFVGGRTIPWAYGATPASYLLLNDGKGNFSDVTKKYAEALATVGMVTSACWTDLDADRDTDLVVTCEWGGIDGFINENGRFRHQPLTEKKGWWNAVLPFDIDHDGDMDFFAGNLGLNSRVQASEKEPVRLYYEDFDDNGKKEQVFTFYQQGKEIPFTNKMELEKQMPFLKKKFLRAEDFANASLSEILPAEKLKTAKILTADYLANVLLINNGKGNFELRSLPWEAQLTSYRDGVLLDANSDGFTDLLLGGNYYENNIQLGRLDADFGTLLINNGKGNFLYQDLEPVSMKGEVRHIREITLGGKQAFVVARNNDSASMLRLQMLPIKAVGK